MPRLIMILAISSLLPAAPKLQGQNTADSAGPPAHAEAAQADGRPPLSGPEVRVTAAPGAGMSFGGEARAARAVKTNLRQYATIFKALNLSDEQRRQTDAIIREYTDAVRAYEQEHEAEMRRLREITLRSNRPIDPRAAGAPSRDAPPPRQAGANEEQSESPSNRAGDPPADGATNRPTDRAAWPVPTGEAREAMEKMQSILKGAPPQEPYMRRLYQLLDDEQRKEFDRLLDATQREQREERARRRLAAAGVRTDAMEGMTEGMQTDGGELLDESRLTPQMRERLRRLRAERQKMLENRERRNPAPPSPDEIEFEEPRS